MRIGILLIVILVIAIALRLGLFQRLMSLAEGTEGFAGLGASHDRYVADTAQKLSPITNMINLTNPVLPIDGANASNIALAFNTTVAKPTGTSTYGLKPVTAQAIPSQVPHSIEQAHACEAAPKNCSAFADPSFAEHCGLSFDIQSVAMDGHVVAGSGLYVSPDDRAAGLQAFDDVQTHGSAPYDPYLVARPTLGSAKAGTFALNKGQCTVVKEKLDCASKQTFGIPNCTQCYTTQTFSRVGPQTGRLPSTLHLFGTGTVTVSSPDGSVSLGSRNLSKTSSADIELPAGYEGNSFTILVGDNGTRPLFICGWLEGPTTRGAFKVDMLTLVKTDTVTGARPRLSGSQVAGGFRCLSMIPGVGQSRMSLSMYMPFTFINGFDGDSLACENGPVITLAESATFLESDPCYGKANQPGNYKMECLQTRWIDLGGTPQGTGWPQNQATMNALQRANGAAVDIDAIADKLGLQAARAYGGTDESGRPLSIADWNAVSMYMTGVPINTPCDGPANAAGAPSPACMSYLYTNQGANSRVGPTYSMNPGAVASAKEAFENPSADPSDALLQGGETFLDDQFESKGMILQKKEVCQRDGFASLMMQKSDVIQHFTPEKIVDEAFADGYARSLPNARSAGEGFADANAAPNTFNYPGTSIDPATPAGQEFAKQFGSITDVKQAYDQINRKANDNTLTNDQRRTAVQQAYGVTLGAPSSNLTPGRPQVYAAGMGDGGYVYTREQGEQICAALGGTTATTAQLQEAQKMGADWCFSGWTTEGTGKWPITTSVVGGCGGRTGIIEWTPGDKAGVNCYGPKPDINDPRSKNLLPFNNQMWDQPTEPTYLTIPSGYLETAGAQPACFGGLSVDQAKKECDALGDRCAGFSYSKYGRGNGCYKGNHNAGMNNTGDYMGYVKAGTAANSGVISGRYIKLEYNHVECLNLAQILVFATKGGPNIITPSTVATKPDGFGGDVFPNRNFVDGRGDSFVHTSCNSVPWIQVDLGKTTTIYKVVVWNRNDCCQSRILGTKLTVLNEDQEFVYISNQINTTNQTYTWLPPDPNVKVDVAEDAKFKNKETPWKCMNGWGAPMRRNQAGDIECMSTNHHDCLWGGPCGSLVQAPPKNVDPLACGAMHAREWGGDGYSSGSAHWCGIANKQI